MTVKNSDCGSYLLSHGDAESKQLHKPQVKFLVLAWLQWDHS